MKKIDKVSEPINPFYLICGLCLAFFGLILLTDKALDLLLSAVSAIKSEPIHKEFWTDQINFLSQKLILIGLFFLAYNQYVYTLIGKLSWLTQKKYLLEMITAIFLLIIYLPPVFLGVSSSISGERYWWLFDDEMISMRYGRNLADGFGLVWNPGERVEGYSNFLWTLYMGLIHLLPLPASKTSLVILLTNVGLSMATIPLLSHLVRLLGGGAITIILSLLGYVFNGNIFYWTLSGAETTLLTFLILLSLCRIFEDQKTNQIRISTFWWIAAISLIRADSFLLSFLLYIYLLTLSRNRKKILIWSAVSLLLPIFHELFRIYYYGDILPNTAYLKGLNWDGRYWAGIKYTSAFISVYIILIAVITVAWNSYTSMTHRLIPIGILIYSFYITFVGGDAFPDFRFFTPILPVFLILAFLGLQELQLKSAIRFILGVLIFVTMPLIIWKYSVSVPEKSVDVGNIKIGLLLKNNTPKDCKVADIWAGSVFYFSERFAIDLLGKSDRIIARLPSVSPKALVGHNKFDFDYSLGTLHPDIVIANFKLPVDEEDMKRKSEDEYPFVGKMYFNKVFREHYFPNPVLVQTWRTIFMCDCSKLKAQKDKWKELSYE
jgi:hypothetical protein